LLFILVLAVVPALGTASAEGSVQVRLSSHYYVNRYGYGVANETVTFANNGSGTVQIPDVQIGLGDLMPLVASYSTSNSLFSVSRTDQTFTVSGGGQSIAVGNKSGFTLSAVLNGVVTDAINGSVLILVLESPSFSMKADTYVFSIGMPAGTPLATPPSGFITASVGTNTTYTRSGSNILLPSATTETRQLSAVAVTSTASDFHPLQVYSATRSISMNPNGNPVVTDSFYFRNMGTTRLSTLVVSPLAASSARVTIQPSVEPRLLSPFSVALSGYSIDLTNSRVGFPVEAGAGYSIAYHYPLAVTYYSTSGGVVTLNLPNTPPIGAFVDTYSIATALPAGVKLIQGPSAPVTDAGPKQSGMTTISYALTAGWAIDDGIPAASLIFVLLLLGLFLSRTTLTEEEETEEESSTERASDMIKAFEEKTSLINGLWPEIRSADPNEMDKAYFDEVRGRLDSFRSRALQRLNEVKQKSTSQKFFDLLSQIHATGREVDRAVKDTLNLYEQFYTRRMRKEVFDRLVPQYTKRLEKALNQLSDELHVVQREAKLL